MKVAVLYTRLTGYWMACMQYNRDHYDNDFLVFRTKPSIEAPFQINSEKRIEICNEDDFTEAELVNKVKSFSPSVLYVAGWTNKLYLKIAQQYKRKGIPVVVGMDNHWKGNIKQYLASILSSFYIKPYFTDIWIPGSPQYKFASYLGFAKQNIHRGLYCADTNLFKSEPKENKKNEIVFVGRLVKHKGVSHFITFLEQLINTNKLDIKIKFIGNGPLGQDIPNHKLIQHISFVHPNQLPELLKETGFLILPSIYEAWGVVVHEALLSGTPVISTKQCGAAIDMIIHGENGFLFDTNAFGELEKIVEQISRMSDQAYQKMSEKAIQTAQQINLDQWSKTLQKIAAK